MFDIVVGINLIMLNNIDRREFFALLGPILSLLLLTCLIVLLF